MKILLVRPSYRRPDGRIQKNKRPYLFSATLPYLAALTPPDIEVEIVEEQFETVCFEGPWELIGLTAMINTVSRGYELADEFRRRGKTVVMGGVHVSALPEEAMAHCDAVVVGEAELVWEPLLRDFQRGELKRLYKAERLCELDNLPTPRYDLMHRRSFPYVFFPVQTTRGCPNRCEFCAVTDFFGGTYRHRPIEQVIRDVKATGSRHIFFVDDNFTADHQRTAELCKALMPLKIKWAAQGTITVGCDPELCRLMARSGCVAIIMGVESINKENLKSIKKGFNVVEIYPQLLKTVRDSGIAVVASLIFGLDNDDPRSLARTVDFFIENNIGSATFFSLLPYPGTPLAKRMEREGRILTKDWTKYDAMTTVIQPKKMTPEALEESLHAAYRRFFSPLAIARRLLCPPRRYLIPMLLLNLEYALAARRGTIGFLTQ